MHGGTQTIVPARRLAHLLAEARRTNDQTLEELATRSGGTFSARDLLALEGATHPLDDDTVSRVVELYGVDPGVLGPERSRLVIDLDERRLRAGPHETTLGAPTADEVLATYLSLLYTMRHATPGTPLPLRDADISVLSRALELASTDVESRLVDLMADPDGAVDRRHRWLRRRLLIPAAGVLVAATAIGSLVLLSGAGDPSGTEPVTVIGPPAAEQPDVALIPPVVMERGPDGNPGPQVTIRDVELGGAIVMERGASDEPGPQVSR